MSISHRRSASVNGVHDLGGMHGFGPIPHEDHEPVFHAGWEARVFAMRLTLGRARHWNADEFRRAMEEMPPASYLAASYYERWLHGLATLLVEKKLVTADELSSYERRLSQSKSDVTEHSKGSKPLNRGADSDRRSQSSPGSAATSSGEAPAARFKPGDPVVARNINPPGHTRLPRYARGRRGIVRRDWGLFVFPDSHAHGFGADRQHCYSVEFSGTELWGGGHRAGERVYLDLWEDYLDGLAAGSVG